MRDSRANLALHALDTICTCIHMYIHTCMDMYIYIRIYYVYVYIHTYMLCICIYTYVYITCMYIEDVCVEYRAMARGEPDAVAALVITREK